jgi:hypothetical protein
MNYSLPFRRTGITPVNLTRYISRQPEFWLNFTVVAMTLLVAFVVARPAIGSGDYGQWLMVSRYYSDLSVPDYRELSAVPPLLPLLVSFLSQLISDPVMLMSVTKVLLAVSLFLASYWAGAGVFSDKATGLVGATVTFLVMDKMLELFAFGGLPQAMSLTFIAISIGAIGRAVRSSTRNLHYWVIGAAAIWFAAMSHAGTGTLAVLAGSVTMTLLVISKTELTRREQVIRLAPLGVSLVLLAPYWLLVIIPQNHEYLVNAASLSYRGPWAFWWRLESYNWNVAVAGAGAAVLVVGAAYELLRNRRPGPFSILLAWACTVWGFFGFSVLTSVGTDYPRLLYPLLQPLALGVGAAIVAGSRYASRWIVFEESKAWSPLAAIALLLVLIAPGTASSFGREAQFHQFVELDEKVAAIERLDRTLSPDASIVTTPRMGKWFEGVTGKPALFAMPNRYAFRAVEFERSLAADAILRSTFSASNGQSFLRYTALKDSVPSAPWVAINHHGEYVDLVEVPPSGFEIVRDGKPLVTLQDLEPQPLDTAIDGDVVYVEGDYQGVLDAEPLSVSQQTAMSESSNSMTFTYQISSEAPFDEVHIRIAPLAVLGRSPTEVFEIEDGVELTFPEMARTPPRIQIFGTGSHTEVVTDEDAVVEIIARGSRTVQFVIAFERSAPSINEPVVLNPRELINEYRIEAALLADDGTLAPRLARLEALGFEATNEAGDYLIAVRRESVAADYGEIGP